MKTLKNTTIDSLLHSASGISLAPNVLVDVKDLVPYDTQLLAWITSGSLLFNDGTSDIADAATAWEILTGGKQYVEVKSAPAFASKILGAKKLYKRVHGIQAEVIQGSNTIKYVIPYAWVKITGLELVGGGTLDKCSMSVLDSVAGTYSAIPNFKLNQFAFSVNVAAGFYAHRSEFDADLYIGMQLEVVYESVDAKTVGLNFIMNEVA